MYNFHKWAEDGKPIKSSVIGDMRTLRKLATQNIEFMKMYTEQMAMIDASISKDVFKRVIEKEADFYKEEIEWMTRMVDYLPKLTPLKQYYKALERSRTKAK